MILRFNAKGSDVNGVELIDAFENYINSSDVVEWSTYRQGSHRWEYVAMGASADADQAQLRLDVADDRRPPGGRHRLPGGLPRRQAGAGLHQRRDRLAAGLVKKEARPRRRAR